jgi:hypothetical protein
MDLMFSSQSTNSTQFFNLSDPLASRPLRLEIGKERYYPTSEERLALFRGKLLRASHVLQLRAYMGGQATDFLWTGLPPLVCISDRVIGLLRGRKFTGWNVYPVEVYDRRGECLPGYFGFAVTGPRLKRDRSRSEIITKPPPTPTGKSYQVYKGLYFDEKAWDGSDFFLVGGSIVVTQSVRDVCKKAKISNVRFTPLIEVEIDVSLDKYHPS